jgi:hypothetical protein
MASPLPPTLKLRRAGILLSGWRGDGALVQSHAFCSTTSTIKHIRSVICSVPILQINKEYKKNLESLCLGVKPHLSFSSPLLRFARNDGRGDGTEVHSQTLYLPNRLYKISRQMNTKSD